MGLDDGFISALGNVTMANNRCISRIIGASLRGSPTSNKGYSVFWPDFWYNEERLPQIEVKLSVLEVNIIDTISKSREDILKNLSNNQNK